MPLRLRALRAAGICILHRYTVIMAAQQSQNVQRLLEAEKDAAKIVQQARQRRVQKLKDARIEAEKEIADYKSAKEREYEEFERSKTGTTESSQSAINDETKVKLKALDESFQRNKNAVVEKLMDRVILVEPKLHRNLKKMER